MPPAPSAWKPAYSITPKTARLLLAATFEAVRGEARRLVKEGLPSEPEPLRKLDRRARIVVGLFAKAERVAAPDVARALGLSERMVRELLRQWARDGWLAVADPSRKKRAYELTAVYRQYVGSLSAMGGYRQP